MVKFFLTMISLSVVTIVGSFSLVLGVQGALKVGANLGFTPLTCQTPASFNLLSPQK